MNRLEGARDQTDHLGNYLTTRARMVANRMAEFNAHYPWVIPVGATAIKLGASNLATPVHEGNLFDYLGEQLAYASPLNDAPGHGGWRGIADLARFVAVTTGIGNIATQGANVFFDKLTQKELMQRRKEGREALSSNSVLAIDLTNQEGSGNHEGEGVIALRKHKEKNPEMWQVIESAFGQICEVVRNKIPQPVNMPAQKYLRLKGEDFRDEETLETRGAGYASAILLDVLDRSHTVFDSDPNSHNRINEMVGRLLDTCNVIEAIHSKQQSKDGVQLPKIAIVNDREYIRHRGVVKVRGKRGVIATPQRQSRLADSFPSKQGYETILAEEAIAKHLMTSMNGKTIALFIPQLGEEIVRNFHSYMKSYAKKNGIKKADTPKFIFVKEEAIGKSLAEKKPDMIFIIGEHDSSVTIAADSIIQAQSKSIKTPEDYPPVPILAFLEGHTSDSTIKRIGDFIESEKEDNLKFNTVYLHDILAEEVAQRLYAMTQAASVQSQ